MRRGLAVIACLLVAGGAATAATNPVVAAARKSATAESSVFQLRSTVVASGQTVTMTGSGRQKGANVDMSLRLVSLGQSFTMRAIGRAWVRSASPERRRSITA